MSAEKNDPPAYVSTETSAIAAVPAQPRTAAYRRYQIDPRDTATPEAMTKLLIALAEGRVLSAQSTEFLPRAMRDPTTFPDRLKASLLPGRTLAHTTGTSSSWAGVIAATNGVGIPSANEYPLTSAL